MTFNEPKDIRTKKAPEHTKNALKNKGNDLSNAEILPTHFKAYHGTDVKFKTFKKKFLGTSHGTAPINMMGFSFTDNIEVAQTFGKHVMKVELKIERPLIINAKKEDYSKFKHVLNEVLEEVNLKKHDGIIIKNYSDGGKHGECMVSNHYIPFKPSQIRVLKNEPVTDENISASEFDETFLKERFLFNAQRVWGDSVNDIDFKFTKRVPKKGHVLSLAYNSNPVAIRNILVSAPTDMNLYFSDSVFEYSKEDAEKLIIHEVIHIGYPNHGESFIEQVTKFGGVKSLAHLEGLGIQVQSKVRANKGERFKTIMTFKDNEIELAKTEANAYAREHRDEKVRFQY